MEPLSWLANSGVYLSCVSPNGTFWACAFESHNRFLLFIEILGDAENYSPSEAIRLSRKATMPVRSAESCRRKLSPPRTIASFTLRGL